MRLKRLIIILLTLTLAFTAAAESGQSADAASLNRARAREDMSVVAVFDIGVVTFDEVYGLYEELNEYYTEMYSYYGLSYEPDPDEQTALWIEITRSLADEKLLDHWLESNGITLLSAAEQAEIEASSRDEYEGIRAELMSYMRDEGLDEDEAAAQAQEYLSWYGLTLDDITETNIAQARGEALIRALTEGTEVSDEEVKQLYEELLASDAEYYGVFPEEFGIDALYAESPIVYIPEGYRRVAALSIEFDGEQMKALENALYAGETPDTARADALYEELLPEALEVISRLENGESFEALMREYPLSGDATALSDPAGLYISADTYLFEQDVTDAIMALDEAGSYTAPLRTDSGYAIFMYVSDAPAGAVSLEDVYSGIYDMAYENAVNEAYEAALARLREEAKLEFFFERLN